VFDVDTYLRRLGHDDDAGVPPATVATLTWLHKRHLMSVPFSSSGSLAIPSASGAPVDLVEFDQDATFDAVVAAGHGGGCVQMNRLFLRLLSELGFEVVLVAGTTVEGMSTYGVEVEHMLLLARLGGTQWLVDVGYAGPSFLEPLRLEPAEQVQYGCRYRLVEDGDGLFLHRRPRMGRWNPVFRFTTTVRKPADWKEFQDLANQKLAAIPGGGGPELCSRAVADGQVVLKGRRYLTVRGGIEKSRTVVDDDDEQALRAGILTGEIT
jgi:amide synthase